MMDRLIVVLPLLEVEHTKVEIGLKVLWVNHDSRLVERKGFVNGLRVLLRSRFQALCARVQRVDVLAVKFQNLAIDMQLYKKK